MTADKTLNGNWLSLPFDVTAEVSYQDPEGVPDWEEPGGPS